MLRTVAHSRLKYAALAAALFWANFAFVHHAHSQVGGGAAGGGAPSGAIQANGPAPTLSGCGTGPSVLGQANNVYGTIVEGTSATGCTLTWGATRTVQPACLLQFRTSGLPVTAVTVENTTTLTWTNASGQGTFDYLCVGS